MAVNGNYIIIGQMSGQTFTPLAAVRSQDVESNADLIEIANPSSGQWKKYVAGRKEWSVNVNYLILGNASANISDVLKVGSTYTLRIKERSNSYYVTGDAVCLSCRVTAIIGNLAQGSFSFRGTGELT